MSTGLMHVYDRSNDGEIKDHEYRFEAMMRRPSELFHTLERIDYVKCDVEGFEYIILSDMKEIIRRHKPIIQVEIIQPNKPKVKRLLEEMGYRSYSLSEGRLVLQKQELELSTNEFIFLKA